MRRIVIIAILAVLGTLPARAVVHTSEIVVVKIPYVTEAELNETVIDPGAIVYVLENPHDVRIGDGLTPGGYRIWNTDALTAPPTDWYTDVDFHGYTITLNERYGFATAGSTWSLLSFGESILDVVSDSTALGVVMSTTYDAPNTQMVVTVGVADTNVVPIVEWSETSVAGPWTTNATWSSTAVDTTIVVRVDIPETSTSGYVRISAVVEEYFDFGLPIHAPSVVADQISLGGIARTNWIASNSFVSKTGDTMTGTLSAMGGLYAVSPLASNELAVLGRYISNYSISVRPGYSSNPGVVITNNVNDANTCPVVIGTRITLSGTSADQAPIAIGPNVRVDRIGSSYFGIGIGRGALSISGVTIGDNAKGGDGAVVVGPAAQGTNGAVRIGFGGSATTNSTSIGNGVNNDLAETTRIRGPLYADGATGIYTRATFESGTFDGNIIFDHAATQIIFQCGGVTWTNKP